MRRKQNRFVRSVERKTISVLRLILSVQDRSILMLPVCMADHNHVSAEKWFAIMPIKKNFSRSMEWKKLMIQ
jgi:hypothetical protein